MVLLTDFERLCLEKLLVAYSVLSFEKWSQAQETVDPIQKHGRLENGETFSQAQETVDPIQTRSS